MNLSHSFLMDGLSFLLSFHNIIIIMISKYSILKNFYVEHKLKKLIGGANNDISYISKILFEMGYRGYYPTDYNKTSEQIKDKISKSGVMFNELLNFMKVNEQATFEDYLNISFEKIKKLLKLTDDENIKPINYFIAMYYAFTYRIFYNLFINVDAEKQKKKYKNVLKYITPFLSHKFKDVTENLSIMHILTNHYYNSDYEKLKNNGIITNEIFKNDDGNYERGNTEILITNAIYEKNDNIEIDNIENVCILEKCEHVKEPDNPAEFAKCIQTNFFDINLLVQTNFIEEFNNATFIISGDGKDMQFARCLVLYKFMFDFNYHKIIEIEPELKKFDETNIQNDNITNKLLLDNIEYNFLYLYKACDYYIDFDKFKYDGDNNNYMSPNHKYVIPMIHSHANINYLICLIEQLYLGFDVNYEIVIFELNCCVHEHSVLSYLKYDGLCDDFLKKRMTIFRDIKILSPRNIIRIIKINRNDIDFEKLNESIIKYKDNLSKLIINECVGSEHYQLE